MMQQKYRRQTKEDKESAGIGDRGDQHARANGGIAFHFGHD